MHVFDDDDLEMMAANLIDFLEAFIVFIEQKDPERAKRYAETMKARFGGEAKTEDQ